jgi:hypothetical protein
VNNNLPAAPVGDVFLLCDLFFLLFNSLPHRRKKRQQSVRRAGSIPDGAVDVKPCGIGPL